MEMLGVQSIPMDERTHVDTGWGMIHNEHVELNAGFAHDPGTSAYEQMRGVCHSRDVAVRRLNAIYSSIDCKLNIMESQAKGKYRDKQGKPLPGADGDLARSCDDQLLDVFRAVKRIAEERKLSIERRDRKRERGQLDDAYDASTGDEAERHDDVELEQQSSDDDNDGQDEPAAPTGHTTATEVTGHHGTAPGPRRFAPTSAVTGASESLTSKTSVTAFPSSACTDGANDGHMSDDASALPESATGGDGCSSGDQQGPVLPFGHNPILVCLTQGCSRRRRVVYDRGHVPPRCMLPHCCPDCANDSHCLSCREVGPQPPQDYRGRLIHPGMSLATQRLIAPPEPVQTALVPQLEQEEEVGEAFFGAQRSSGDFIDDGDDDESPGTASGSLKQREDDVTRVAGWCNGDAMQVDGSMTIVTAGTLSQMPHGRWRSCTAMGVSISA